MAPVGPLTWRLLPPKTAATMPAMTAAASPAPAPAPTRSRRRAQGERDDRDGQAREEVPPRAPRMARRSARGEGACSLGQPGGAAEDLRCCSGRQFALEVASHVRAVAWWSTGIFGVELCAEPSGPRTRPPDISRAAMSR